MQRPVSPKIIVDLTGDCLALVIISSAASL